MSIKQIYRFHWCPSNKLPQRENDLVISYHLNCCCSFGHLKIVTVSSFWHGSSIHLSWHMLRLLRIDKTQRKWTEIICYVNFIAGEYLSKEKNKSLFSSVYPLFYRIYRSNSIFWCSQFQLNRKEKKKQTNQLNSPSIFFRVKFFFYKWISIHR